MKRGGGGGGGVDTERASQVTDHSALLPNSANCLMYYKVHDVKMSHYTFIPNLEYRFSFCLTSLYLLSVFRPLSAAICTGFSEYLEHWETKNIEQFC
jgi:hypothetical protein